MRPEATTVSLAPLQAANLNDLPRVRHGFFTRTGGVSRGVFASLNCGLSNEDDEAAVEVNRARAAAALGLPPQRLVTVRQVHGRDVVRATDSWAPDQRPPADALVTDRPGLGIGVLAADCGPVLFADAEAGVIGAAHAGWKGALAGVIEATVLAMTALGADRRRIRAALGPCIAQASYEVSDLFRERFLDEDPDSLRFFATPAGGDRPYFDLKAYVEARLRRAGLAAIEILPQDTYSEPDRFFSFRRTTHEGGGGFGVMLSAIALADGRRDRGPPRRAPIGDGSWTSSTS